MEKGSAHDPVVSAVPAVFNSVCQNPRSHTVSHKRRLQPTTQAMAELVHGGHRVQPVLGVVPDTCTASRIETHKRPNCPSLAANLLLNRNFSYQIFFFLSS